MEALDSIGRFWLPGSEENAVYGSLVFDPADGTTLTLAHGLSALSSNSELHQVWDTSVYSHMFGTIRRDRHDVNVTLVDCITRSSTTYRANLLLVGGHFAADDLAFHQMIIRRRDLPAWVAQEALIVEVNTALDGMERRELRVHLDRPPATRASFERGDLSLDFRWSRADLEYEQLTIRQWPQVEIAYTVATSLTEIMDDFSSLNSLLTLCTDGPGAIDSVGLYRPDHPERMFSGEAVPDTMQKIELLAAFVGSGSRTHQKRREPYHMLVSFGDVGGISTVANWLNERPQIKVLVGSLVSMRADTIFGENRFLNVCSAAEGFHRYAIGGSHMDKPEFKAVKRHVKKCMPRRHRSWFDSRMAHANEPSLNQRLKQLADQLGPVAPELVGDVAVWGRVVSNCRNDLTHTEGSRDPYNGADLYWLAEGVFNITRLCLLLHVGLDRERLPKLVNSWPIQATRDRVLHVVERLARAQKR